MKQFYIQEENTRRNELAFYGPFKESEVVERLNDAFADFMAEGGANIDAIVMSDEEASAYYINPREFWMEQLATYTKD